MGPRGGVRRGEGHGSMSGPQWTKGQETPHATLLALLKKARPFVWRAMQGGKAPHAQDKADAEVLWSLIKDLEKPA